MSRFRKMIAGIAACTMIVTTSPVDTAHAQSSLTDGSGLFGSSIGSFLDSPQWGKIGSSQGIGSSKPKDVFQERKKDEKKDSNATGENNDRDTSKDVYLGDTIYAKNFVRKNSLGIPVHFHQPGWKQLFSFNVWKVSKSSKEGMNIYLDGFAGYKDMKLFNSYGEHVATITGSNGGKTRAVAVDGVQFHLEHRKGEKKESLSPKTSKYFHTSFKNTNPNNQFVTEVSKSKNSERFTVKIKDSARARLIDGLNPTYGSSIGSSRPAISTSSSSTFAVQSRENIQALDAGKYFEEAVALGLPHEETFKQQLDCHVRGSKLKKNNFSLEATRPALNNNLAQSVFMCNVPNDYNGVL